LRAIARQGQTANHRIEQESWALALAARDTQKATLSTATGTETELRIMMLLPCSPDRALTDTGLAGSRRTFGAPSGVAATHNVLASLFFYRDGPESLHGGLESGSHFFCAWRTNPADCLLFVWGNLSGMVSIPCISGSEADVAGTNVLTGCGQFGHQLSTKPPARSRHTPTRSDWN
jgi:hypothetical protein